jgi:hypothetical protein
VVTGDGREKQIPRVRLPTAGKLGMTNRKTRRFGGRSILKIIWAGH